MALDATNEAEIDKCFATVAEWHVDAIAISNDHSSTAGGDKSQNGLYVIVFRPPFRPASKPSRVAS